MTSKEREEAIKWIKENPFYHKEHKPFNIMLEALEQEPILDNIRAEIDGIEISGQIDAYTSYIRSGEQVKHMALEIIDKHIYTLKCKEVKEAVEMSKVDVFDKIIAEIEKKCCITVGRENDPAITLYDVFQIIDKYRKRE